MLKQFTTLQFPSPITAQAVQALRARAEAFMSTPPSRLLLPPNRTWIWGKAGKGVIPALGIWGSRRGSTRLTGPPFEKSLPVAILSNLYVMITDFTDFKNLICVICEICGCYYVFSVGNGGVVYPFRRGAGATPAIMRPAAPADLNRQRR